ncbi:MAG: hypothetical protein VKI93_05960, partial [Synechococcus sp.]|nr:hypothetical protein [Synechococcus sp.]
VLALKNAALPTDEEITLDYKTKKKDQESGVIEDLAGNDLQSIKNVDVDNNTFVDPNLDLMAPTIVNAEIKGDVLTITLDEAIDSTVPKANNFKVKIGRKKSKVESVDVFDTTKLIAADLIDSEGAATSAPSHNSIIKEAEFRALIGVFAASNGQSAIFTTVAPHDPSFANGVQATVGAETFEWNVAGHGANPDAGTGPHATRDGDNLSFTDDELAAMRSTTGTVSLKLKNAALPTDTEITLDYKTKKKDQVTGVIEDLAGNDLQSLKDFEVSNVTTPNTISGLSAEVAVPWVRLPSIGGVGIDPEVLLDANPDPGLAGNPDVGSTFFSKTFGVDGMGLVPIATEIVDSFSAL